MKIKILLFCVGLFVASIACNISAHTDTTSPVASTSPDEQYTLPSNPVFSDIKWEQFNDAENGFSINYPSTWFYYRTSKPYDNISEGSFVLFSSTLGNTSIQIRTEDEESRLVVNTLPNNPKMDVESWLAQSPLLQSNVSRLTINGFNCVRIVTSPVNGEDSNTHIFLFLVTSTRRYSLIGTISPSKNAALWQEVIIRMQATFNPKN